MVVTLSKADEAGKTSVDSFLSWPSQKQERWIPLPFRNSPDEVVSRTATPTPQSSGPPLEVGGWYGSKPQWLCVESREMQIRETDVVGAVQSLVFQIGF